VLCSRVSRSSVLSNVSQEGMARRAALAVVPLPMLMTELVRRDRGTVPAGEAVRASDLDGVRS
jgi:hypothetical protein